MLRSKFIGVTVFGLVLCGLALPAVEKLASATDADDLVQAIQALKVSTSEGPDSSTEGQMGALQAQLVALNGGGSGMGESGFLQAPNDLCVDAVPISCAMQSIDGTTVGATTDTGYPSCGSASVSSPGVWYTIVGNGGWIRVDTCTNTSWDTKISVFSTSCDVATVTCIDGNDDFCGVQSEVEFVSTVGQQYWVLVHGYGGATGTFTLGITCEVPVELQSLSID